MAPTAKQSATGGSTRKKLKNDSSQGQGQTCLPRKMIWNCNICEIVMDEDGSSIECEVCKSWIHKDCSTLTDEEFKFVSNLGKDHAIKFICGKCQPSLEKCKQAENDGKNENSVMLALIEQNKMLNDKVCEIMVENAVLNEKIRNNKEVEDNVKLGRVDQSTNSNLKYSEVVIKKKADSNNKDDTRKLILDNIHPSQIGVRVQKLKSVNDNELIITCDENDKHKMCDAICAKLGEELEITVGKESKKMKRIEFSRNVSDFNTDDDTLIEIIKKQNELPDEAVMKIIKRFKVEKKSVYEVIILDVDVNTYDCIMIQRGGRLAVEWVIVRVKKNFHVIRCYKCQGYNHMANNCGYSDPSCGYCGCSHESRDCTRECEPWCVNCDDKNKKLGLNLDPRHYANAKQCPVYQEEKKKKEKRLSVM